MGQIRKRGAFYQIRYYRNGQRIEESTGKTRYDEARSLTRPGKGHLERCSHHGKVDATHVR